jgi:bifunctional UDP-N-acetylglucosamine pyrophosphorylase/glucosamine-1-phosphate N-acetyltransferase
MNPDLSKVSCIILAAGKGVRMKSDLPKVLHALNGKPLIGYVLDTVLSLNLKKVAVVVGYQGEKVIDFLRGKDVEVVWQKEQLGTGHAVMQAEPLFRDFKGDLLVLCGDVPLLKAETIIGLFKNHQQKKAKATVLTAILEEPKGYGRIVRDKNGDFERIVEDKDAAPEEKKIREINTGEMCFSAPEFFSALKKVKRDNLQKEYYITDVLGILKERGERVEALRVQNPWETKGINSTSELLQMEEYLANTKLKSGVEHKA